MRAKQYGLERQGIVAVRSIAPAGADVDFARADAVINAAL